VALALLGERGDELEVDLDTVTGLGLLVAIPSVLLTLVRLRERCRVIPWYRHVAATLPIPQGEAPRARCLILRCTPVRPSGMTLGRDPRCERPPSVPDLGDNRFATELSDLIFGVSGGAKNCVGVLAEHRRRLRKKLRRAVHRRCGTRSHYL